MAATVPVTVMVVIKVVVTEVVSAGGITLVAEPANAPSLETDGVAGGACCLSFVLAVAVAVG